MHNGPREPTFAQRFCQDPTAVDAILFQDWGTRDAQRGWLAAGIEEQIAASLEGWRGSAVLAEWGYARNQAFPLLIPGHAYCDAEHTRRGAWRGAMSGLGIIHGFENSWGPFLLLEEDQEGLAYLLLLRRFFREVAPFQTLRPAPELLLEPTAYPQGARPLALASPGRETIVAYLPVGGTVGFTVDLEGYQARWFSPVTGELQAAQVAGRTATAPDRLHANNPQDWALVLTREGEATE